MIAAASTVPTGTTRKHGLPPPQQQHRQPQSVPTKTTKHYVHNLAKKQRLDTQTQPQQHHNHRGHGKSTPVPVRMPIDRGSGKPSSILPTISLSLDSTNVNRRPQTQVVQDSLLLCLPDERLLDLISFIHISDLVSLARCCRRLYNVVGYEIDVMINEGRQWYTKTVLTEEQEAIVDQASLGKNLFISGEAGTGKSLIIRSICKVIAKQKRRIYVTASTGQAASLVNGVTLHSFSGMRDGQGTMEDYAKAVADSIKEGSPRFANLVVASALVVEEVSMLQSDFIDKFDAVCRLVRHSGKPFGGIQMIFCGDFHQLPPVNREKMPKPYAFQSRAWADMSFIGSPVPVPADLSKHMSLAFVLTRVFRQKDPAFLKIIRSVKYGSIEPADLMALNRRVVSAATIDAHERSVGRRLIRLHSINRNVDEENETQLALLRVPTVTFESRDEGPAELMQFINAPRVMELKTGCRVIVTKNGLYKRKMPKRHDDGRHLGSEYISLYNGSCGTVVSFDRIQDALGKDITVPVVSVDRLNRDVYVMPAKYEYKTVERGSMVTKAWRMQVPLKLGYAFSIHRSQGMTVEDIVLNPLRIFADGQLYVALSRVKTMEGLYLTAKVERKAIMTSDDVLAFYYELEQDQTDEDRRLSKMRRRGGDGVATV